MITVEALTKRYGRADVLSELSFTAAPGRVTALLGPNGAGKSTTLRILLGLARPTSGAALVDGQPYATLADPATTVGAVLEVHTFHPWRTARVHLSAIACAAGIPAYRVADVLRQVELNGVADRNVGTYSLGMRQRLSLAAALLGEPQVLVLDEPQNGLDPQGTRWLREVLRGLADHGRTVLVSSHLLAEVAEMADDLVIVRGGRLVRQSTYAELLASADEGVRVGCDDRDRLAGLLADRGWPAAVVDAGHLRVRGCAPGAVYDVAAANGIRLHELTVQRRRLEDVFLELTS